ncbi:hypothetical protein A2U01_0082022 [Trifolium medium]|uniref:Uncharacterized protein n=1 Tax=Trifolium medium TaxID=97028 RepID=A0A392TKV1_9FABA|nr:hypothetical protein [Trifolium medium]
MMARRAVRAGATRSALVQSPVFFWGLRDAQLRLARRAELLCFAGFVSSCCAARAGGLRGTQVR